MKRIVIAIDGYSGAGKSTIARAVAKAVNYIHVDTGAMYRALTYFLLQKQPPLNNLKPELVADFKLQYRYDRANQGYDMVVNGAVLTDVLRTPEVDAAVGHVSSLPWVREFLVKEQRRIGRDGGVVMEGRDIGTVVFPDTIYKFFIRANLDIRAKRRLAQLLANHPNLDFETVRANLQHRDELDENNPICPLLPDEDALILDSGGLELQEIIDYILTNTNTNF